MSADRHALLDEIALRRASIADAESEFRAGELSQSRFDTLTANERTEIERCESLLATLGAEAAIATNVHVTPSQPPRTSPRRHRRYLLVVALVCFLLAVGTVLYGALGARQPGSSDTGSISTTQAQHVTLLLRAAEASQLASRDSAALTDFNAVLVIEPTNIEALTQSGWLSFSAGSAASKLSLIRLGENRIVRAIILAPKDPDPRLYYAIMAASTPGAHALARAQFRIFVSLKPSATLLAIARPWMRSLGLSAN